MRSILKMFTPLALILALGGSAYAMGGESDSSKPMDPNYLKAKQLIEDGNYAAAIPLLQQVVAKDAKNADAFNYLGYSNRQLGEHDFALTYYQQALTLNPKHRGANEYLGELYLKLGDLPKAQERLDVLDGACFFGCDEYTELKNAIAAYKAKTGG